MQSKFISGYSNHRCPAAGEEGSSCILIQITDKEKSSDHHLTETMKQLSPRMAQPQSISRPVSHSEKYTTLPC